MVRTKADAGVKSSGGKAPRKGIATPTVTTTVKAGSSKDRYSGGNSVQTQPTPEWQKGITCFFKKKEGDSELDVETMNKKNLEKSAEAAKTTPEKSETTKKTEEGKEVEVMETESCSSAEKEEKENFQKNGLISDDDD